MTANAGRRARGHGPVGRSWPPPFGWRALLALCALCALDACNSLDKDLLASPDASAADGSTGHAGAGGATDAAVDARAGAGAGGVPSMGGVGGMSAGTGAAGDGGAVGACHPNSDTRDEVCPLVCPETCNDTDDDCDRRIDEGDASAVCGASHATAICRRGECVVVACDGRFRDCDGVAANGCEVDIDSDVDHCGSCGVTCDIANASVVCVDGACEVAACAAGWDDCDADPLDCEKETNTLEDCGACGVTCTSLPHAIEDCSSGTCAPGTCVGNFGDCNDIPTDGCEQALATLTHCGACGAPCALGGGVDDCSSGVCLSVGCSVGFADCDGDPSDGCEPLTTADDCGGCGKRCDLTLPNVTSASCGVPGCEIECAPGYGDCADGADNGCETRLTSVTHCDACNAPCTIAHAVAECATGTCQRVRCDDGYGDCDGLAESGCERSLDTLQHCGACNVPCAKFSCAGGVCSDIVCSAPTADCDGDGTDCEVDLSNDAAHCGSCTHPCAFDVPEPHAAVACVSSACELTCTPGYDDCDGDAENGCETALDTTDDCGSCGTGCAVPNGTASCASGQCRVQLCDPDWADCDGDMKSCETRLDTTQNCGVCGMQCAFANAVETCAGAPGSRSCAISTCEAAYYRNCDGQVATGCEVDDRTDAAHCGACGNACATLPFVSTTHCAASACVIDTCVAGRGDCTAAAGCETALDTVQNCGACGNACAAVLAHTTATACNAGSLTCEIVTCSAGYADCDGMDATGCETDIRTVNDCGGCSALSANEICTGLPNVATSSCATGACMIDACAAGFANCDGVVANGCERDTTMLGPCLPDASCTKASYGDSDYYFCTAQKIWTDASTACKTQTRARLVAIESAGENDFVRMRVASNVSIGAGDAALEGLWRWSLTGVPFWQGNASGSAVPGRYANWLAGEPGDSGAGEDCAELRQSDGKWNDVACSSGARAFVCEEIPDRCPEDAAKIDPGQCGCGVPDTDTDADGFADCAESCDTDPAKQSAGVCGCGTPDTDSDQDGTPNCNDACPGDPAKIAAGICGCGVSDVDTDLDTFVDCNETCDTDPLKQAPGTCGCGVSDADTDMDGAADCNESCDTDPLKQAPGICGCGVSDADTDMDGTADCNESCDTDPLKQAPGICGCGVADTDSDGDGFANCLETCDTDATKQDPGDCGCRDAPMAQGTACNDGRCPGNVACDGAGDCGTLTDCRSTLGCGEDNACAISDGGRVICWGDGGLGELGFGAAIDYRRGGVFVKDLYDAIQVVVGSSGQHACALRAGGQVLCWGYNLNGRLGDGTTTNRSAPVAVSGITTAVQVSAGSDFGCALLAGGEVRCWGNGASGRLGNGGTASSNTPVAVLAGETGTGNLANVVYLVSGEAHSCAVLASGRAVCWGDGGGGRLGENATSNRTTPVLVHGVDNVGVCTAADPSGCLANVRMLAAGENVTLAIHTTALVSAWGNDTSSENGIAGIGEVHYPRRLTGAGGTGTLDDAVWIAIGRNHGCVVRKSGQLACWGEGAFGRLGDNSTSNNDYAVAVSGPADYAEVAAGQQFTCARRADGRVRCTGNNGQGQLGDGTTAEQHTPVDMAGAHEAYVEVDSGWFTSCAVTDGGAVDCWGEGNNGEIGRGNTTAYWAPARVPGITTAADVAVAQDSVCALLSGGTVKCWGYNVFGQLGDGTTTQRTSPVNVSALTGAVQITGGQNHFCALKNDGSVWCWGYNVFGMLGNASTAQATTPVQVHGVGNVGMLANVVAIGSGHYHTCAVRGTDSAAYTVVCWGLNDIYQLGDGTPTQRTSPVAVGGGQTGFAAGRRVIDGGRFHSCALKTNGEAWCWGWGNYGKLGDGATTNNTTANAKVAGGYDDFVHIAAFSNDLASTCAVRANGEAWCWGFNDQGEVGDQSTTQRNSPVRVHHTEGASLRGNTDLTSAVIAITVGQDQALAIHQNGRISGWGYNGGGQLGDGYVLNSDYPVGLAPAPE